MTRNKPLLLWPLLALVLVSCVTINIYFPAAAAEEAARTIVRDVLGKEGGEPAAKPEGEPQSRVDLPGMAALIALRVLDGLVSPAHAAGQADIDISSPAISSLRASLERRQPEMAPFYRAGVIGFDTNGTVAIRDLSAASLRDRAVVKRLVAEENRDRNALYREIARANGRPDWEPQIRSTFARVWAEEAPRGYWYQTAGGWKQR